MPVDPAEPGPIAVTEFDAAPRVDAAAELLPCCASRRWIATVLNGRPYGTLAELGAASDNALAGLEWDDIEQALAAHPRIGERSGSDVREAGWSRQEQAGTAGVVDSTRQALAEGNRAYEDRFGHVFLICATGLSAEQMLASLRSRLRNDPVAEREVVRSELTKIVRLRLAKAFR